MQYLKSTVNEFIKLVHQLKFLEAHQYYSEDIVNIENEGEPVIGFFCNWCWLCGYKKYPR